MDNDQLERALIQKICQKADRHSMERLYNNYRKRLSNYIYRVVGTTALVEEVFNDVMMIVWQKSHQFNGSSKVSTWIFSIAFRQCLAVKRKEAKYDGDVKDVAEQSYNPNIHGDRQQLIEQAMLQLSAEQRSVIELAFYLGFSYPEIAKIIDCPVNTVKTRIFHSKRKLRNVLENLESSCTENHQ